MTRPRPSRPSLLPVALALVLLALPSHASARLQEAQGDDPARRFADALRLIEEGDLDRAIGELESLRTLPEAPPSVAGILGALYVEMGEMDKGLELLQPIAESDAANPAVLYNAGRAAAALGDAERAFAYLSRSVEMEPGSPASRELGLLFGSMGAFTEGYRFLLPWVRQNPDDMQALLAAAIGAVQLERVVEAEELLSELDAEDPGVKLLWGQLLVAKGDPWGAIGYLRPMLETAPDVIQRDIRYTLAGAYMTVGESAGAVELLEGREGGDPQVSIRLAQALYQSGGEERALEVLEPFATGLLDENNRAQVNPAMAANVLVDYGNLLNNLGRSEEALPFLRLGTDLAPSSGRGWQALGQALVATGQREEAQAALGRFEEISAQREQAEAAARDSVDDPAAQAMREAMRMASEGRFDEALGRLEREMELAPDDPRLRLFASQLMLRLERPGEALETALALVEMTPDNADALYMVGAARMALEDMVEAEEVLRRVLQLAPEHTPAMNDLAVLLIASGRDDEARTLLQRVLELQPDDPVARENLDHLEKG